MEKDRSTTGPAGQELDVYGRCVECDETPREAGVTVPSCLCALPPISFFKPRKEAAITIDGKTLTHGQSMTVRVAISSFRMSFKDPEHADLFGPTEKLYDERAAEIEKILAEAVNG